MFTIAIGSMKNDIGSTIAIAIKVVNPGNAPTNNPINKPNATTNIIVKKLLLPNKIGNEFKKLSNNIKNSSLHY